MNKIIAFTTALLISLLCSCGPKVTISPQLAQIKTPYIALLPTKTPDGIKRERVHYIRELTKIELEEKGYIVLNDEIVSQVCENELCPSRETLQEKYAVARFLSLSLESISHINFLAGFTNSLKGELRIENSKKEALYQALHTARNSGGLILESGQIIQAIINQSRSGDESAVDTLSYHFIYSALKQLPSATNSTQTTAAGMLHLKKATARPFQGVNMRLCAEGTPNNTAWLSSKTSQIKSELREIAPGQYCGVFRLMGDWSLKNIQVELHSAFGDSVRKRVSREAATSKRTTVSKL